MMQVVLFIGIAGLIGCAVAEAQINEETKWWSLLTLTLIHSLSALLTAAGVFNLVLNAGAYYGR